jgi:hypothetical protein
MLSHSSLLVVLPSADTHSERDAGSCCVSGGTIGEDSQRDNGFNWLFRFLSSGFSLAFANRWGRLSVWCLALGLRLCSLVFVLQLFSDAASDQLSGSQRTEAREVQR